MPDPDRTDVADSFAAARAALAVRLANRRAAAGERLTLDEVVAGVVELHPLPAVAFRVLELADDGKFSAHELASLIASDQALTAKILRLGNSPFYGFARRITTVRDAVVLLGFRAVRQATLAACVVGDDRRSTSLDYDAFWQFCVATRMLAEVLAHTEGVVERSSSGVARQAAERDVLGFTTADLGGALAEHWGFPSELVRAIGGHTRPIDELAVEGSLAATIARARLYARSYGMADGITPAEQSSAPEEWSQGPLSVSLRQAGGMEKILERVDAFMAVAAS